MMLQVISTGFASKTAEQCRRSIKAQDVTVYAPVGLLMAPRWDWDWSFVDASTQTPPKTASENVWLMCRDFKPDDIVVWVDLDDWLAGPHALAAVAWHYEVYRETLCTYGSFVHANGAPGFASPYRHGENPRKAPWRATHLKTFKAGLVHRIDPEDLKLPTGEWTDRAVDMAYMFPIMEMAGLDRCRFIPEVLYVYNSADSFEANATPEEIARERRIANHFRCKPSYKRIDRL
ncbi:MAG: hypothetical protein HRJ53_13210 [Acidobacteria bacterium Pan2503]|uniref:Glycosyltransferase n=1 Tax=Candidatus Acidiferrum panamense TaxID=2741543 RepID=A0A7V8SXJ3_9BACT|nr:hypothetical protein [Candidatus Acidoferrum panamensis]